MRISGILKCAGWFLAVVGFVAVVNASVVSAIVLVVFVGVDNSNLLTYLLAYLSTY